MWLHDCEHLIVTCWQSYTGDGATLDMHAFNALALRLFGFSMTPISLSQVLSARRQTPETVQHCGDSAVAIGAFNRADAELYTSEQAEVVWMSVARLTGETPASLPGTPGHV